MPSCERVFRVDLGVSAPRRLSGLGVTCVAALLVASVPGLASAAPTPNQKIRGKGGNFGAGISIGDPLGLTGKYFLAPNHALQFDFGWALMHHGIGRVGADYLWHPGTFASTPDLDFMPYIGGGVMLGFWAGYCHGSRHGGRYGGGCSRGGAAMLLRAPILGLAIHWKMVPLDTVLEGSWSPFVVLPDVSHGDVSFKVRYYF